RRSPRQGAGRRALGGLGVFHLRVLLLEGTSHQTGHRPEAGRQLRLSGPTRTRGPLRSQPPAEGALFRGDRGSFSRGGARPARRPDLCRGARSPLGAARGRGADEEGARPAFSRTGTPAPAGGSRAPALRITGPKARPRPGRLLA